MECVEGMDTEAKLIKFLMAKAGAIWATKYIMIVLGYNPQNKINIHKPILI